MLSPITGEFFRGINGEWQRSMAYFTMFVISAVFNGFNNRAVPAKVSKLVQKLVDQSFKSFFKLLDKKNKGKYNKPIHIPKYLDKTKGRQVVTYTEQALLKRKHGYIGLLGVNLDTIKFKVDNNNKVRFIRDSTERILHSC